MTDQPTTPTPASTPGPWRRRRILRWVLGTLLALTLLAGGAYYTLTSPRHFATVLGWVLSHITHGRVQIEEATFAMRGPIEITGFTLRVPGMPAEGDRLFTADRIYVTYNPWPLLWFSLRLTSMSFVNPVLHVTEDLDQRKFNFQRLMELQSGKSGRPPEHWPEIYLGAAKAVFGRVSGGQYQAYESVDLTGNLMPSSKESGGYSLTLVHQVTEGQTGEILTASFTPRVARAAGKLERFGPKSPLLNVLPQRVMQWWRQMEPTGHVEPITFGYDPDPAVGFFARMEVSDFELSLPYGESQTRLTQVAGVFELANETIAVQKLHGQLEDIRCLIDGKVHGFKADAPFELSVVLEGNIPAQPRYLFAMPPGVQRQFARFSPSGLFHAQVDVLREQPGSPLNYNGVVRIRGVSSKYVKFPYPMHNLEGQFRFNQDSLDIDALEGLGPHDNRLRISGRILPPGEDAAVDIRIQASDVPLDQVLFDSLDAKYQPIFRMFLDQEALARLSGRGVVVAAEDPAAAQRPDRVFALGGKIQADIRAVRAAGKDKPYQIVTRVQGPGTGALFTHWPYPVRVLDGQIIIDPQKIAVEGLKLQGLSGAILRADGKVDLPRKAEGLPLSPDLQVAVEKVPVDDLLLASIGGQQERWLRELGLEGAFDGKGVIVLGDDKRVDFTIDASMQDGRARPFGGQFVIGQVNGTFALKRHSVTVHGMKGAHGGGRFEAQGQASWREGAPAVNMKLAAFGLHFEEPVLDLIPQGHPSLERLRPIFAEHQPRGLFDAELDYRDTEGGDSHYTLAIKPYALAFDLRGRKVDLTDIQGKLLVTPEHLWADHLWARAEEGTVSLSALMDLGPDPAAELTLDVAATHIGETTRAFLPQGVLAAIHGLELQGDYTLEGAHLTWRPQEERNPILTFSGPIRFNAASANVGVPVTELQGQLQVTANLMPGQSSPFMKLTMEADKLRILGRLVENMRLRMGQSATTEQLLIEQMIGSCYGGVLTGTGQIDLGKESQYRFALALQDVAYDPMVHPEQEQKWLATNQPLAANAPLERNTGTALLSASLAVGGALGDSESRFGRGELFLRDAHLVQTPLGIALLHILNLNLPMSKAFDRVTARYLIDGDLVRIDRISFESPSVEVIGSGLLRYSSKALDLRLYSRNPAGLNLGPISGLLNLVKDELLSIRVTGTLDEPQTQTQTLSGVSQSLNVIFGRSARGEGSPILGSQ
ncbi:MAG: AsmA-like C-terminal domain-containing protein [Phycisphaeraceae bacterium]|nr:AsmA-like C-terminal domain-containing protein [Phycisphaeraceae bacterium]